jgi:penicillin-binding protein 2
MNEPSIFFNEVNERQGVFTRRVFLMGGLTGIGIGALTGRLAQLQLIQNEDYRQLSDKNQYNFRLIVPPRGLILDRNNVALASNRPNFRVLISRDSVKDVAGTLESLGQIIPLTPERRRAIERQVATTPRFTPVSVADDLTWEQFAAINIRAPELPGVTADMGEARVYPFGGAFAHVIGYVAKASKADLESTGSERNELTLHPSFRIGKQGVEKALDKVLRGRAGGQKVEVDARGRVVRQDPKGDVEPTPGAEVILTLDADIQNRALEVFGEESGAAVVMDCRTGDLLCMASSPSFDANRFVKGISQAEYSALANYERRPLLDKALTGTYPPGSTFKPMTALAALASGMIDPEWSVPCPGFWNFGGRTWRCWRKGGHGMQNMHNAIKNSCDVYFYQAALKIGPDRIAQAARAFGFGQTFEIGIPGQKKGIVPDRAWKKQYYKDPRQQVWFPGESPSYGIGQGYINVNMLQLAVMVARLANGKKALNPRLIKSIGGQATPSGAEVPDLPFSKEYLDIVRGGMAAVANDTNGTAYRASQLGLGPIMMAGKTGSAQVRSYDKVASRSNEGIPWKLRDHGLFIAFAPYDDPRYAISVLVEHGKGGAVAAAPRAREIMRVALLKDPDILKRIQTPTPMPDMGTPAPGEIGEGDAPPLEEE